MRCHVRWMIRRDLPWVLEIEAQSFEDPLGEDGMLRVLRRRNAIGLVAEIGDKVVGFATYELYRDRLELVRFAVHKEHRHAGYGRALMAKLVGKLNPDRRNRIELIVRESCYVAQVFLRALRFRATKVERGHYRDTGEDGYVMEYRVQEPSAVASKEV